MARPRDCGHDASNVVAGGSTPPRAAYSNFFNLKERNMPVYDELSTLVNEVNTEVVELDSAKAAKAQAEQVLTAAKTVVTQESAQVEEKLDALLLAVQARLAELQA